MSYRLPPLPALRAFEAASRHLSFKKAAEELHVTPAAISQQVKALEDYLGVALFRRLTRALEITPHGAAMLPKIREGFECLAAAVETARSADDGVLTVSAPPSFASRWLIPRLARFSLAHPHVALRITGSATNTDRRDESPVLDASVAEGRGEPSKVTIRYGTGNYPGFRVEKIFSPDWVPICSPQLITAERPLATPADLRHHVLIHDETIDDETQASWSEWLKVAGVKGVNAQRGPRFSNAVLAAEAALDSLGVALTLRPMVEADIAAGRLIIPFDIPLRSPYAYYLVMQEAMARRPAVAAFHDWLLAEAHPDEVLADAR